MREERRRLIDRFLVRVLHCSAVSLLSRSNGVCSLHSTILLYLSLFHSHSLSDSRHPRRTKFLLRPRNPPNPVVANKRRRSLFEKSNLLFLSYLNLDYSDLGIKLIPLPLFFAYTKFEFMVCLEFNRSGAKESRRRKWTTWFCSTKQIRQAPLWGSQIQTHHSLYSLRPFEGNFSASPLSLSLPLISQSCKLFSDWMHWWHVSHISCVSMIVSVCLKHWKALYNDNKLRFC